MKEDYIKIFIDDEYPSFISDYLKTKSFKRLKYITQFCGCDYSKLYSPKFMYTRYDHSIVVAHMTWHFTHNKKETLAALLHDIGTPAFSHTIDYVLGDYLNQESSEIKLSDVIKEDKDLMELLRRDGIDIYEFDDLKKYHILENSKPFLCTDRLDGVLGTCYIWIHKDNIKEIEEVYKDLEVLKNENNIDEIGFKDIAIAEKFSNMVYEYALEVQCDKDKYVMQYISDVIKQSIDKKLFDINYLYSCKEKDLINIFRHNFKSWDVFEKSTKVITSNNIPDCYCVSFETKKRNTIPLVSYNNKIYRIDNISNYAKELHLKYDGYKSSKYIYVQGIKNI